MNEVYLTDRIEALNEINFQDLLAALGWRNKPILTWIARGLLYAYPRKFAKAALRFDEDVGRRGLHEAARDFSRFFTEDFRVSGAELVPPEGPVLFVSNHPGLMDTLLLFGAIPRNDLRIIAAKRPFLQALPNAARSLVFVEEPAGFESLRAAVGHLKSGGALLTFPAGRIEPDPALYPKEAARLEDWSSSTALFLRMVPGLRIVPVRVSGVLSAGAQFNILTHLRKKRADREHMGAMLQLVARFLSPGLWPIHPKVEMFRPIAADDVSGPRSNESLHRLLLGRFGTL